MTVWPASSSPLPALLRKSNPPARLLFQQFGTYRTWSTVVNLECRTGVVSRMKRQSPVFTNFSTAAMVTPSYSDDSDNTSHGAHRPCRIRVAREGLGAVALKTCAKSSMSEGGVGGKSECYTKSSTHKECIAVLAALKFNSGGHNNHSIVWKNLAPASREGKGACGSFFSAATAAIQGSGWAYPRQLRFEEAEKTFAVRKGSGGKLVKVMFDEEERSGS
ncbi:hypothetical protein K503DRAFT_787313 [Rhizopogon vinicolor AM-OR11-026]|uniref:Uncharacterized protein n=1 Tax=Rhizopogon vinicolor AM-OR11-026 TaxID=1314800 RepID=A0A1B7MI37_9AGAM|nr:hypothetical protein K503DRAFT_787313 [Rhizopogon vinicolor AM-OR11-026]